MAQRSLVLVPPAIRERRQSHQTHIDPNGRLRVCLRHPLRHFDGDGDKPPVCCFTDARREDFARKAELFRHIHPAQFGNLDPVTANGPPLRPSKKFWKAAATSMNAPSTAHFVTS